MLICKPDQFGFILLPMYPTRIISAAFIFVLSLVSWFCLLFFHLTQWVSPDKISKLSSQIEFLAHFFTFLVIFPLFTKLNSEDRSIIKWFLFANICLFLNDLSFYFTVYFPNIYILSTSFFTFTLGYIPYLIWISSIIIFLSKILVRDIFNLFDFFKALPFFILFNLLITFLFFSSIHYAFYYFSWSSILHMLSFMSEFIIFDLALLCLIYSESNGLSLALLGFITLISGDFFVNYSFLSQTSRLLNYGELFWFLGLIFISYGIFIINENKFYSIKQWFSRSNTIKNKLAFWTFGASILSFLIFFIVAYLFSAINTDLFLALPLFIMMYSVIVVILSIQMGKRFEAPFKKLTANVEALMLKKDKNKIDSDFSTEEFIFLQKFIMNAFEVKEQKEQTQQALLDLTAQVAHDIRSPLAAINTVLSDITSIAENKRIIIRNAAKRINDIANNLLFQSKNNFNNDPNNNLEKNIAPELIFVVIENIIIEKKYEYSQANISISLNITDCSYNCFSIINLDSFKRVLSNLINNSIEAVDSNGTIIITLTCNDANVEITIEDDGCGIPLDILHKVTEQGFSFNKKKGAGFGLSYAKQYLEQIKAKMLIYSKEKIGTKIIITLVRSNNPYWFCDSLYIKHNSTIVVLDDDPSIHDAWNERFATTPQIKLLHFQTISELLQYEISPWLPVSYLVDYELIGEEKTGLEVIEELRLNDNAMLVTSSFEDVTIRKKCEDIGVKIIPKSYVPYIEIIQTPKPNHTHNLVLIDDDEMMRTTWTFAAEVAGENIATYSSFDEFINKIHYYSKNTVIFIDSDLGNDIKGELCAKYLFDNEFTEIHLTTGHSKEKFSEMPWIKSIVGKEPPFL